MIRWGRYGTRHVFAFIHQSLPLLFQRPGTVSDAQMELARPSIPGSDPLCSDLSGNMPWSSSLYRRVKIPVVIMHMYAMPATTTSNPTTCRGRRTMAARNTTPTWRICSSRLSCAAAEASASACHHDAFSYPLSRPACVSSSE